MQSYVGHLLVAAPPLIDPHFWRTVVLMIQHDEDATAGVVLNRPTLERVEDHLDAWTRLVPEPGLVHYGGPVEPQVAIAIVSGDEGEPTGLPGVSLGDLSEEGVPSGGQARIYAGYSGWGEGQLEAEIREGSWYVVPASPSDPFDPHEEQWARVLRRQRGHLALVSTFPDDVTLN